MGSRADPRLGSPTDGVFVSRALRRLARDVDARDSHESEVAVTTMLPMWRLAMNASCAATRSCRGPVAARTGRISPRSI